MKIPAPIKIHGGKSYLAERIVAMFPEHLHYVEPFFGGGSVLLAKPTGGEGTSEVVGDADGALTNFWRVLQDESRFHEFSRILSAMPFSQQEFEDAKREYLIDADADPIRRAVQFFVVCRQSMAGRRDSFAPLTRNRTRRQINEQASAWLNSVEGLYEVHRRLIKVVVLNQCALKTIRQQDGANTLFYLDPPYVPTTRATFGEYGDNEMTEGDEATPETGEKPTHIQLLDLISTIKGKFVLSGYPSVLYARYATKFGWKRQDFVLPNNAASGSDKRRMTECVWTNF